MTIQRTVNGIEMEFELSQSELLRAFYEQEHKFDISEIGEAAEQLNDGEENIIDIDKLLADEDLCITIIERYKDELYEDDGDRWRSIIEDYVPDEYYTTK